MSDILHTLEVQLPLRGRSELSHLIGRALLSDGAWQSLIAGRGVILVTDDQVGPLYASR